MSSVSSLNSLLSSSSTSSNSSLDISSLLAAATGATSPGIDVSSAVEAAIYAAQAPERQWQTEQATLQSQITALTSLQTSLSALSNDADALSSSTGALASRMVTSSNTAVAATASVGAATGSHSVQVSALATTASWYSPALSGPNAALGSSAFTVTQSGGRQTAFSLGPGGSSSLSSLVNSINSAGIGITASVIQDASGSRLALVSSQTGASGNFTVTNTGGTATTWDSAALADPTTPLAAGTYQIGDGASTATLAVQAGTTLSALASQINGLGLHLTASVSDSNAGAQLVINASSGASVSLSADPTLTMTQASTATNAALTVDGVPVTSESNMITGAIPGVSLQLSGLTGANPVSLDVTPDTGKISSAITQFVTDYNSAISSVSSQFSYTSAGSGTGSQGVLGSDPVVRTLQSTLLGLAGYSAGSQSSSAFSTLAGLGITMNNDGTLSVDSTTLGQLVASNPSAVSNFFQGQSGNGFASAVQNALKSFTEPGAGTLAADINSLAQQYSDLQSDINNYESGYIASQKTLLTTMYSQAEIALQSLPTTVKQLQAELGNGSGG